MPEATSRRSIPWPDIGVQYRAGIRSLKDIGAEFGVSDAAIVKAAKREGWIRDLKAKVQARADAKVSAALVSAEVSEKVKVSEELTVELEAQVQSRIRLAHRADIGAARELALTLLGELREQTANRDGYESVRELLDAINRDEGKDPAILRKLQDALDRALGLGGRTKILKDLSETLRVLIDKERQAFGIDDDAMNGAQMSKMLAGLTVRFVEPTPR